MKFKRKTIFIFSIILLTILISISITYAYFTALIEGNEETTSITTTGGVMNITYNGGANINISNIFPNSDVITNKTFSVTGNNTTGLEMFYNISLVIESNTFTNGALKYKLFTNNIDGNGIIPPNINNLEDINEDNIFLGNGSFTGPTNGNKVHDFNLEIYFPSTNENQNIDQGKEFKAYIKIEEGKAIFPVLLTDTIFNQYGGEASLLTAPIAIFDEMSIENENAMYKIEDDYGTSYYYRGAKDYINNNLIFANHQWKIARINGNGTIRLVYNGICPNNSCLINNLGTET